MNIFVVGEFNFLQRIMENYIAKLIRWILCISEVGKKFHASTGLLGK